MHASVHVQQDVLGRRLSWNVTLLLTFIFGMATAGAPNFVGCCGLLACIGLGVGGNLPVDGALLLELLPGKHQWLVNLLSVFWVLGQVYAALIGWGLIPRYSCPSPSSTSGQQAACTRSENMGWRYTWIVCSATCLVFWLIRFLVYPIPESPKFLLAQGDEVAALNVVRFMAEENGAVCQLTLADLRAVRAQTETVGHHDHHYHHQAGHHDLEADPKEERCDTELDHPSEQKMQDSVPGLPKAGPANLDPKAEAEADADADVEAEAEAGSADCAVITSIRMRPTQSHGSEKGTTNDLTEAEAEEEDDPKLHLTGAELRKSVVGNWRDTLRLFSPDRLRRSAQQAGGMWSTTHFRALFASPRMAWNTMDIMIVWTLVRLSIYSSHASCLHVVSKQLPSVPRPLG